MGNYSFAEGLRLCLVTAQGKPAPDILPEWVSGLENSTAEYIVTFDWSVIPYVKRPDVDSP